MLFEAATAFDNVRRLQILRLLQQRERVTAEALAKELSMSRAAVARQAGKLVRRGFAQTQRQGHKLQYRLVSEHKTPIHADLWALIADALEG